MLFMRIAGGTILVHPPSGSDFNEVPMTRCSLALLICSLCASPVGWTQPADIGSGSPVSREPPRDREACRQSVARFERAIGLIRQTQGQQAAAELKEKLVPAQIERDLLMQEGYCGLARHLHEKKLDR